jgi:hypothetical protein
MRAHTIAAKSGLVVADGSRHDAYRHLVADTRAYLLALEGYTGELAEIAGEDARAAAIVALIHVLLDEGSAMGLKRLNELATEALKHT